MIEEDYVSFELAKQLKEKGFPQNISFGNYYELIDKTCLGEVIIPYTQVYFDYPEDYLYCPTLALVQKWLREEKNICIEILGATNYNEKNGDYNFIGYRTHIINISTYNETDEDKICVLNDTLIYDSYEEALERGINKALELI